jgi:hypothetical protein
MKIKKNNTIAMQLPGALALAAAGAATQANAATVQITFNNSYISSTSGKNIDGDFGGDLIPDLSGRLWGSGVAVSNVDGRGGSGRVGIAYAFATGEGLFGVVAGVGDQSDSAFGFGGVNASMRGLVALSFTDTGIRAGAQTTGYLDMTATATAGGEKRITVNRLIFDDATGGAITGLNVNTTYATYGAAAVPEPSGLALLALGAGGLLARRRRAMAA